MQKDGIITIYSDEQRKTVYQITSIGNQLIKVEIGRIKKLYSDTVSQEEYFND